MGERLFDALIVIDVQQALVDGHPSKEDSFLVAVGAMIDACRRADVPVLYVCHDGGAGDELERGTDGWRVHCAVAPQAGEIVVDKRFNSAFRQTGLHETLQSLGAKRIVMCGMQTEFMEEVLIDDNMVFDIDNLKGFLNDTSSFGFIAKENNKIIGFAYCYTLLRPDGKTMFYLHSIGMLPNYQDKGYGSKLLSFIKEYSKEIGCSEMFLITDKGNPRACHVYEKLGGKNDYKDEIVYVYDYEKGDK